MEPEEIAFPSIRSPIPAGEFILVVGQNERTHVLKLAISTGGIPTWDEACETKRFPASHVAVLAVDSTLLSDFTQGHIQTEQMELACKKDEPLLIYVGKDDIDRWCVETLDGRTEDAVRIYRLVVALDASVEDLPRLHQLVLDQRKKIFNELMELLSLKNLNRTAQTTRKSRLEKLVRVAIALGLEKTEYVQRARSQLKAMNL